MKVHTFSYIITYKHSSDRLIPLKRVLDWINGFGGVDVIVVEQGKNSKIENLNLKCRHIFLKNDGDFNKSWAYNVGAKYAKSDIIVFGDSDIIMNPNDFINGLKSLDKFDVASPYNVVIDLTPQESNISIENMIKINRTGRGENDNQKINLTGGIIMFKKEAIFKIGGWCELFTGWGGEDDFQTIKVKKFLSWTELEGKCYHMYHSRENINQDKYQRTLNMLNQLSNLSNNDLEKHITSSYQSLGLKNKYN